MKTLYLECLSGISGDMTVGALLDLGGDEERLRRDLESLCIDGYELRIYRTQKCGIDACKFDVVLHESGERHSHAQEEHEHNHSHHHNQEHSHNHEHTCDNHHHGHARSHHPHTHRNLRDILQIIDHSGISPRAKDLSRRMFEIVADAEAKCHGLPVDQVHFHEVGAVDSIVDIVAVAVLIDQLGIQRIVSTPLYEGTGTVKCQHGIMPVPAPATARIAADNKVPIIITDSEGEMVTPTGAAIIACLADSYQKPQMVVEAIGIGAGTKDFAHANILRAYLYSEESCEENKDQVLLIEANVDDMTGEELGYAMEKLLEQGARDVFFTPIYMKKNRPATKLSVICNQDDLERMAQSIFKHTSTIGVRYALWDRVTMSREMGRVNTKYGEVAVKRCWYPPVEKISLEYESIRRLAEDNGISLAEISREAEKHI